MQTRRHCVAGSVECAGPSAGDPPITREDDSFAIDARSSFATNACRGEALDRRRAAPGARAGGRRGSRDAAGQANDAGGCRRHDLATARHRHQRRQGARQRPITLGRRSRTQRARFRDRRDGRASRQRQYQRQPRRSVSAGHPHPWLRGLARRRNPAGARGVSKRRARERSVWRRRQLGSDPRLRAQPSRCRRLESGVRAECAGRCGRGHHEDRF